MKNNIHPIGWAVLFMCISVTYCLLTFIFTNLSIAIVGVVFGTIDLVVLTFIFINGIFTRDRELEEIELKKTWIDRALEKKI